MYVGRHAFVVLKKVTIVEIRENLNAAEPHETCTVDASYDALSWRLSTELRVLSIKSYKCSQSPKLMAILTSSSFLNIAIFTLCSDPHEIDRSRFTQALDTYVAISLQSTLNTYQVHVLLSITSDEIVIFRPFHFTRQQLQVSSV